MKNTTLLFASLFILFIAGCDLLKKKDETPNFNEAEVPVRILLKDLFSSETSRRSSFGILYRKYALNQCTFKVVFDTKEENKFSGEYFIKCLPSGDAGLSAAVFNGEISAKNHSGEYFITPSAFIMSTHP